MMTINAQNWSGSTPGNIYYNGGNVGIGESNPTSKLEIRERVLTTDLSINPQIDVLKLKVNVTNGFVPANTENRILFSTQQWSNGTINNNCAIGAAKETDINGLYGGGRLVFYTLGGTPSGGNSPGLVERMRIDRLGNVEIHNNIILKKIDGSGNNGIYFYRYEENPSCIKGYPGEYSTRQGIQFSASQAPNALIINWNGNVGIGTTNPGSFKLAVEGKIGAREVVVTNVAWYDFVFEPEYKLMSLKDLETYIKDNKHLPEIPTTAQVEENGIAVGEMNAKLLQKIEELTLYTIQQQELIETLLNRVEQIENKTK